MLSPSPAFTYDLTVRGPLGRTGGAARGERELWELTHGVLDGPGLHAETPAPGVEWMHVPRDGFGRPDVRIAFTTGDGATLLLAYTGLVEIDRPEGGYMRMALVFDTGAERYRWLAQSLWIARGTIESPTRLRYAVHRVE